MKKKLLLLTLPLLAFCACHHEGLPAGVMTEAQMVDFLTDAYRLEGFYAVETQYRYDVLTEQTLASYDSILKEHGLSREQVERSFDYYSRHLDTYGAIHDSVVARLEREVEAIPPAPQNNLNASTLPADSIRRSIPHLMLGK